MSRVKRLLVVVAFFTVISSAQQPAPQPAENCGMPSFSRLTKASNMFSPQQEAWLGDVIDDQLAKSYNMVEDPGGDYLQKFGDRILAQMPDTGVHYRFYIIDLPIQNAFSIGGSRIYVTRQLIAFLKNDDELAGLLGHELGHIVTHQRAVEMTRLFKKVLGVNQIGDRKDIFDKWNQLLDVWGRKNASFGDRSEEEDDQLIADRVGVFSMTRAGYDAHHFAEFFDRLTENKGRTGNFLTDFFGTTKPESKRVREIINKAGPLPQGCISAPPADSAAIFLDWQKKVIGAGKAVAKEDLPGLLRKATLKPPLRGSLEYLQFSPDGKYLIAQDESSVFLLTASPLANLFRIDALKAHPAQFSADSRSVVFYDHELRVQKWDIESRQRTSIQQITLPGRCHETQLSPTGDVLACVRLQNNDYFQLDLIDVNTSQVLYSKHLFPWANATDSRIPDYLQGLFFRYFSRFALQFSPDSHYFVLGSSTNAPEGYDLQARKEVKLPGKIKQLVTSNFTFVGPNRLAGFNAENPMRSALVTFPGGETIKEFPLEVNGIKLEGKLFAPARGGVLLISPAAMYPIAALDMETGKIVTAYKTPGMTIFGSTVAGEEFGGKINLYSLTDRKPLAGVQLPFSPLPNLETSRFSADGKWLVAAGHTSGGIWNAETGQRALDVGSFTGGFFDQGQVFATFYKFEKPKVMKLDPADGSSTELFSIEGSAKMEEKKGHVWQSGGLLLVQPQSRGKFEVEAHDIRNNQLLWKHQFANTVPVFYYSEAGKTLSLVFDLYANFKDEAKNDPQLAQRLNDTPDKGFTNLVQVLDPATGKTMGSIVIDTGKLSFFVEEASAAADTVLVHDSSNRTQVYSLKSGRQTGKVPGRFRAISSAGDKMLVENGEGQADIYDTATLQPLAHFSLPSRVVRAEFAGDGNSINILTADQVIYNLKNPGTQEKAAK